MLNSYKHAKTEQINESRQKKKEKKEKEEEERPCKARLSLSQSWVGEGAELGSTSVAIFFHVLLWEN